MKKIQILFAEDNDDHAELIVDSFDECKDQYQLIRSHDGQQLINDLKNRLRSHSDLPDVILLDIKMPSVDGVRTLQKIKSDQRLKKLPVIMLTTSNRDTDIDECYRYGADGYMVKPFSYNDFSLILRKTQFNMSKHI
ncbi:response regulator [Teredinibacter sp. KSP-S5-2]|uniref:response regulator n=1 Tax=Teredinibacter sp. KSP-S5-2 TaxID=3034506 RepID=UPI0029346375|nr:response regulator [Teredinibacter sp. KSP-S5-2]WNO11472.1 response regulator [Teredinibacter sp. KSP-S5-2]